MRLKQLIMLGGIILAAVAAAGTTHPEKPQQSFGNLIHPLIAKNDIDVLHYHVNLTIFPEEKIIDGWVKITLKRTNQNAADFSLNILQLTVDSVEINAIPSLFEQTEEIITIPFPDTDQMEVTVYYHGKPGNDGSGGFFFKDSVIYSYGEGINSYPPSMLRYWVPSHDVPNDKATLDMSITVPRPFDLVSNGELISLSESDTNRTFHWREDDPIATYLIAFAAADYDTLEKNYLSTDGDLIPLRFYVLPEYADAAQKDWENINSMMSIFENWFGPYPFEQYSMVQVPHRGAMEHQSMTAYSSSLITGDLSYEYIIAHELAHQWWGDWVTLSDWREIWLNEGFASYSEVLFFEVFYGEKAKQEHLQRQFNLYKRETFLRGHFSIYDPEYMWGGTVYDKGSWVLHRLRWFTRDSHFREILTRYGNRFAYGNATIAGFQAVAEEVYGKSLDTFFDIWLQNSGYPTLRISWDVHKQKNNYITQIEISRPLFDIFPYPFLLEIEWNFPGHSVRDTLNLSREDHVFIRNFALHPSDLVIDPDQVMLVEYDIISEPLPFGFQQDMTALSPVYPVPARIGQFVHVNYHVSNLQEPQQVMISVVNSLGQHVKTLIDRRHLSGVYDVSWDGRDENNKQVSSGMYILYMRADKRTMIRKFILLNPS